MARKKKEQTIWPAVLIGSVLILWPEPLSTATGILIVASAFGVKYIAK